MNILPILDSTFISLNPFFEKVGIKKITPQDVLKKMETENDDHIFSFLLVALEDPYFNLGNIQLKLRDSKGVFRNHKKLNLGKYYFKQKSGVTLEELFDDKIYYLNQSYLQKIGSYI